MEKCEIMKVVLYTDSDSDIKSNGSDYLELTDALGYISAYMYLELVFMDRLYQCIYIS